MTAAPINVSAALASFDEPYSPRIVARMNDYEVRVAHTKGEHVWHVHEDTDEFFLVLDGQFDVAIRDANGSQTTVTLRQGDMFVVPKGTEHKPSSPGASILMFEPSGTSTTGDRHEGPIPAHVDSTTGHELDQHGRRPGESPPGYLPASCTRSSATHSALPQVRPEPRRDRPHRQAGRKRASQAPYASSSAMPPGPGTETTGRIPPPGNASHSRGLSVAGSSGTLPMTYCPPFLKL